MLCVRCVSPCAWIGQANRILLFWYLDHVNMRETIMFQMHNNNYIKAAGKLCVHAAVYP